MTSEDTTGPPRQNTGTAIWNALIIKIALFLNYLSKDDYQKLSQDLKKYAPQTEPDILKLMLEKRYVTQQDIALLKKTGLNFARIQEDDRFGSLCINFEFITQSNLDLALEEQKRLNTAGNNIMLGDLLVDAGMISERQRSLILQKQKFETTGRKTGAGQGKDVNGKQGNALEPVFDKTNTREIREPEMIILIQNDALKAFVKKTKIFNPAMALDDLKELMEKYGIIYGVIDDDSMNAFIRDPVYQNRFIEIAKGLAPKEGKDAQLVYMFERNYLKAGHLTQDGTMDFKDRGDLPSVAKGDVLVEKIPLQEGKDGINIYGDVVPAPEAADITFTLGQGVCLSHDKLKVIADTEGIAKVKSDGEISVNDTFFIDGDVDYTTGHIKFNKNVFIKGSIKNGFKVEAIDVVANSIDGGSVNAMGDVFIQNGATESLIQAKGTIKTGFMHRSKAACMGDMVVVKEIVDSDIILEGTFEMTRGRVFSSSICAKGGAKIYSVGSEKTGASRIVVGASVYLENELRQIDTRIERRQNLLEQKADEKSIIKVELSLINEKLAHLEQTGQQALERMEEMEKNSSENPGGKMEQFKKTLDEAGKQTHGLNEKKLFLENRLKKTEKDMTACTEAIKNGIEQKFALKRFNQSNPPRPILDVAGKIVAGTKISGLYSTLVLNQTLTRSRIMETNSLSDDGSKKGWEMMITRL